MNLEEKAKQHYPADEASYSYEDLRAAFASGARIEQSRTSLGIDFYSSALGAERKQNQQAKEALLRKIEWIEQRHSAKIEIGYEDEPYCSTCVRQRAGSLTYQSYPCKTAELLKELKDEIQS